MPNVFCFQPLKFADLLFFFVICDSKLNILRFWTVGQTKQANWKHHHRLWEIVNDIFLFTLLTLHLLNNWSIIRRNNQKTIIINSCISNCDNDFFFSACFNIPTGQRSRQVSETWSHRGMCNKPQEAKTEPPPSAPAHGRVLDQFNHRYSPQLLC